MKLITKNKKSSDCSVVATFNALAWCNKQKTYQQVEKLAKSCGYNPRKGLREFQFINLLNKTGIPYRRIKNIKLNHIQSELYLGKCFIFVYFPHNWKHGHFITIFMNKSGAIQVLNTDNERLTWNDFAAEVFSNVMSHTVAYELPNKNLAL